MNRNFRINIKKAKELQSAINKIDNELVKTAVNKIYGGTGDVEQPWLKAHGDVSWGKSSS